MNFLKSFTKKIAQRIVDWADSDKYACEVCMDNGCPKCRPERYEHNANSLISGYRTEGALIIHPTRQIVSNRIRTPDGTILISHDRHDFKEHMDANGHTYAVDGGCEYLRRLGPGDHQEMSVYIDDPFEVIRTVHCRGGRGKSGDQPLKWVPLCEMSNAWLENCITYNSRVYGLHQLQFPNNMYDLELKYRKLHGIFIADEVTPKEVLDSSDFFELDDLNGGSL